jgi:hypothetical protein
VFAYLAYSVVIWSSAKLFYFTASFEMAASAISMKDFNISKQCRFGDKSETCVGLNVNKMLYLSKKKRQIVGDKYEKKTNSRR